MNVERITTDNGLLVAVAERLVPSLNGPSSYRFADALEFATLGVLDGEDERWLESAIAEAVDGGAAARWRDRLAQLEAAGVHLVSVCDVEYPSNLRMIANRPPLLFVRGALDPEDNRAIAVVGTRRPSEEGRETARRIATALAERDVTVVSGLADGIDAAAHAGALSAHGRTVAVFGTGIDHVYPATNRRLAADIAGSGACVSQFLPAMRGTKWSFPVRNIVTSGLSIGTVVVEAGETSGARIQAQDALRHGKRLFLMRSLVASQPWAAEMSSGDAVVVVDDVDEVMTAIDAELLSDAAFL